MGNVQTVINQLYYFDMKSDIQSPNRQHISLTIFHHKLRARPSSRNRSTLSRTLDEPVLWLDDQTLRAYAHSHVHGRVKPSRGAPFDSFLGSVRGSIAQAHHDRELKRVASWSPTTRAGRRRDQSGLLGLVKKQESEQTGGVLHIIIFFCGGLLDLGTHKET